MRLAAGTIALLAVALVWMWGATDVHAQTSSSASASSSVDGHADTPTWSFGGEARAQFERITDENWDPTLKDASRTSPLRGM
jgi:hypothetical protein